MKYLTMKSFMLAASVALLPGLALAEIAADVTAGRTGTGIGGCLRWGASRHHPEIRMWQGVVIQAAEVKTGRRQVH